MKRSYNETGWLYDSRECWEKMSQSIISQDWEITKFSRLYKSIVPFESGIYLICASPAACPEKLKKIQFCNVMYVGIGNLRNRFMSHLNNQGKMRELRETFKSELNFIYTLKEKSHARTVEKLMIECFNPALNVQGKVTSASSYKNKS